jgi:membrane protein implicated in regulation of membrane protease activity
VVVVFFPSRSATGSHRFFRWKLTLFVLGTGAVLAGARFEIPLAVNLGIVLLAIAIILRLLGQRKRKTEEEERETRDVRRET